MHKELAFEKKTVAKIERFIESNQQRRAKIEAKTLIKKSVSVELKVKILAQFETRFDEPFYCELLDSLYLIGGKSYEFLNYYAAACSRLGRPSSAIKALRNAITIRSDNTLAYLNLFRVFLSTADAVTLKQFVLNELDHSQDCCPYLLGEGSKIAYEFGNKSLSLWLGERSLELRDDVEIKLIVATRHLDLGNLDRCADLVDGMLDEYPERLDIQNLHGLIAYRSNQLDAAESIFRNIITKDPQLHYGWINLSIVLLEAKKALEALDCALVGYDLNPNADAAHTVGNAYRMNGMYREAVDYFAKSFDLSADIASLTNLSVALLDCGESAKSLVAGKKVVSINPDYAPNYWNLVSFSSDIKTALALFKKYIQLTGHDATVSSSKLAQRAQLHLKGCESLLKGSTELLDDSRWSDEPIIRSYRYWIQHGLNAPLFYNRWKLFDFCIQQFSETNQLGFYEFGVFTGYSFRYISSHFDHNFGFDTFSGIPEDWHGEKAGTYSSYGKIPDIENAEFFAGLFEETLPVFMNETRPKAAIINFDADLYSSTITALNWMEPVITQETILIFDEFLINDHWELDEYKALEEFCKKKACTYQIVAGSMLTKQVAVKLKF